MNNLTTFYIVRHGQSEGNANYERGVVLESTPLGSDLTELGKQQVRETYERLKDIPFDKVYSSDLQRAHNTAKILTENINITIETTQLLRERSRGKIVGDLEKKLSKRLDGIFNEMELMSAEERQLLKKEYAIELREETVSRFITFLREVAIANPKKTILISTHGAMIRSLLSHLGYASPLELLSGTVENAGYIIVESDGVEFYLKETYKVQKRTSPKYK